MQGRPVWDRLSSVGQAVQCGTGFPACRLTGWKAGPTAPSSDHRVSTSEKIAAIFAHPNHNGPHEPRSSDSKIESFGTNYPRPDRKGGKTLRPDGTAPSRSRLGSRRMRQLRDTTLVSSARPLARQQLGVNRFRVARQRRRGELPLDPRARRSPHAPSLFVS